MIIWDNKNPTPFKDMINQVICGDCLEVMRHIPYKSIDLVLTDPPYGIKINRISKLVGNSKHKSRKATNENWDDCTPDKTYFNLMFKISVNQIVFGANYFWENFYKTQCYLIWDKRGNLPDVPFCDTEFAWTSFVDKPSKRYVCINHGFIKDSKEPKLDHPTQKPEEVFRRIINDFTKETDLVIDTFLGSGTTAIACKQLGRNFIGIEKELKYCEIAERRLSQEYLF